MLTSYTTGLIGLLLVLVAWVAVQNGWRKVFPDASGDPDPLAGRLGCRGACEAESCPRRCSEPLDAAKEGTT